MIQFSVGTKDILMLGAVTGGSLAFVFWLLYWITHWLFWRRRAPKLESAERAETGRSRGARRVPRQVVEEEVEEQDEGGEVEETRFVMAQREVESDDLEQRETPTRPIRPSRTPRARQNPRNRG